VQQIYHVFMEFYLIMKVEFYIMNWNDKIPGLIY